MAVVSFWCPFNTDQKGGTNSTKKGRLIWSLSVSRDSEVQRVLQLRYPDFRFHSRKVPFEGPSAATKHAFATKGVTCALFRQTLGGTNAHQWHTRKIQVYV